MASRHVSVVLSISLSLSVADSLNEDREVEATDNTNGTSGRRQQLPPEIDEDVLNKSFKGKVKAMNSSNTSSTPPKKSILRKSTKSSLRK